MNNSATNNIDTLENVNALILKVSTLIDNTTGAIRNGWRSFLRECEDFIYMLDVQVEGIEESKATKGKAILVCQANDLQDYEYCKKYLTNPTQTTDIRICRIVDLPKAKFSDFSNDLMAHWAFFRTSDPKHGFGGTGIDYDLFNSKFPQYGNFETMEYKTFLNLCGKDKSLLQFYRANAYEVAALIRCKDTGRMIVSGPQGYTYSRYTSFEFTLGA